MENVYDTILFQPFILQLLVLTLEKVKVNDYHYFTNSIRIINSKRINKYVYFSQNKNTTRTYYLH